MLSKTSLVSNDLFVPEGVSKASIGDVISYLKDKEVIGLDIETSRKYRKGTYPETIYKPGLDPYLSRVVMLQIGDLEHRFVIDTRTPDIEPLREILENHEITKVGHNLKFEASHLLVSFGIRLKGVWDTMLCEMNLTNGLPYGYTLLDLAQRYFDVKDLSDVDLFSLDDFNPTGS